MFEVTLIALVSKIQGRIMIDEIKEGVNNISGKPHLVKDLFLIAFCVPASLTLLFFLPSAPKEGLILHHADPNPVSLFTTSFMHENLHHFLSNFIVYFMLMIPIYLFSRWSEKRRKFYLMILLIFVPLPFLISSSSLLIPASKTFLSMPASKSLGFSGINSALFGFVPYFALSYLKKIHGWEVRITNFMNLALFLLFGLIVLSYLSLAFPYILIPIAFWAFFSGLLVRTYRKESLKNCLSSIKQTFEENRFFRGFSIMYILSFSLLFPEKIRIASGIIDVNVHLVGFAFGFVVSYLFLSEEFRGE